MAFANVGTIDRIIRVLAGGALIGAPFFLPSLEWPSMPGVISMIAGVILALTALFSFCPIYGLLRLRTRPKK